MTNIIWFIPLLPVIGFVVTLLLGGKFGKFSSRLATVVLGICMFLSFYAAYLVFTRGEFSIVYLVPCQGYLGVGQVVFPVRPAMTAVRAVLERHGLFRSCPTV